MEDPETQMYKLEYYSCDNPSAPIDTDLEEVIPVVPALEEHILNLQGNCYD